MLDFNGGVNTGALSGRDGTLLLDPDNIVIADVGADDAQVADGTVNFTDGGAVTFTISDEALEAVTGNILLQANIDITVNQALVLINQGAGESVTFDAGDDIVINAPITTSGASIRLNANVDPTGIPAPSGDGSITVNAPLSTAGAPGVVGAIVLDLLGAGTGTVQIGANLQTDGGNVTVSDSLVFIANGVAVDTEQGDDNDAGDISFSGPISANAFGLDISLNASSAGAAGGDVSLGVINGAGGGFLNDVSISATGAVGGRINLFGNISLDANGVDLSSLSMTGSGMVLNANVTIDTEIGDDGSGGSVDLTGLFVGAGLAGFDLSIDTSTLAGGASGGAITLGSFGAVGGAFVNDLTLASGGAAGSGPITLTGDIFLERNGADLPLLTASGDEFIIGATSITIDTEDGNDGNGGAVNLSGVTVVAGAAGRDLIIDTSTGAALGGAVTLGVVGSGTQTFVNDLLIATGAATTAGGVTLSGNISLDNDAADGGDLIITGNGPITTAASLTIDTEQLNNGAGGLVDLGSGALSAAAAGFDLTIDTSTSSGAAGGAVSLGLLNGAGGGFLNDVSITTSGAGGGVVTFRNNISLGSNGGDVSSLVVVGPSSIVLAGDTVIDTDSLTGATNAGDVSFPATASINGGNSLTIDASADGGGLGGSISLLGAIGDTIRLTSLNLTGAVIDLDEAHVTGNISLIANDIDLVGGADSVDSAGVAGALTIQPTAAGVSMRLGAAGAGTLVIDAADVGAIGNFAGGLFFGRTDGTSLVNVGTAAFDNNTTIRQGGVAGAIAVIGAASTTGGSSLTFAAGSGNSGNFTVSNTGSVDTGAGAITIFADSDLDPAATISTTSTITLRTVTASRPIVIGAAGARHRLRP